MGDNRYGKVDAAINPVVIGSETGSLGDKAAMSIDKSEGSQENTNKEEKSKLEGSKVLSNLKPSSDHSKGLPSPSSREFWQVKAGRTPLSEKSTVKSADGRGSNADIMVVEAGE